MHGEDLETVSRELGVTAAALTGWHDAFLAAGEAALMTRAATGEELESERLKARLGAALIERVLLNEKIAILESALLLFDLSTPERKCVGGAARALRTRSVMGVVQHAGRTPDAAQLVQLALGPRCGIGKRRHRRW